MPEQERRKLSNSIAEPKKVAMRKFFRDHLDA
jgi:hypothetical protein